MRIRSVLKWTTLVLVTLLAILVTVFFILSPGKTTPIKSSSGDVVQGSVAEIVKLSLGGVDQYVILRGKGEELPVLLFLHGGPGSPETAFLSKLCPELEETFVVAQWEQRGAGKSFSKAIPDESMTLERMVEDAHELTGYLKERFGCDKVFLMGHSWGSQLGMYLIENYPDDYVAYFGVGQAVSTRKSEEISLEWVATEAERRGDDSALGILGSLDLPHGDGIEEWLKYILQEKKLVEKYGGSNRIGIDFARYFLLAKEYSPREKLYFFNGNSLYSLRQLWKDLIAADLNTEIPEVEVPVYMFQGIYDYQTPYALAKEYFDNLVAPRKGFYTFENSAHYPHYEEKDRFMDIIREILNSLDVSR